jgi:uncharacterized protein YbbC (DUF1343 family)
MKFCLSLLTIGLTSLLTSCQIGGGGAANYPQPQAQTGSFALGIDRLGEDGYAVLRGKRVGLITNHTSRTRNGTPSRVALQRGIGRSLTALYTPEHGLDGKEPAGNHVASRRDSLTGLPAYSLYGATRKPSAAMLSSIDVLLFDLQDIGSRSYTYISTMALAMEAAAENGKQFIVLDRPNPMGGQRVQGPPLEASWKSFVGQIPVPYVHGMTAGELARMINGQGWIKRSPSLMVVPMRGWNRGMTWTDTGLRWVATSPNIPGPNSPFYYAATGVLGGLDGVDIGIGTSRPFEYAGGKGINPNEFAASMNQMRLPGVRFAPYTSSRKPGFAGVQIMIDPHGTTDLLALDIILTSEIVKRTGGAPLRATRGDTLNLFHKVYGSSSLWRDLNNRRAPGQIIAGWQVSINRFLSARQGYLLY